MAPSATLVRAADGAFATPDDDAMRIRMLETFPISLDGHSVTVLEQGQTYNSPAQLSFWHAETVVELGKAVDADAVPAKAIPSNADSVAVIESPHIEDRSLWGTQDGTTAEEIPLADSPDGEIEKEAPAPKRGRPRKG